MPTYPAGSPPNDAEAWGDAHRPWPVPKHPWVGFMTWLDLLFAHWPINAKALSERVPRELQLDTFKQIKLAHPDTPPLLHYARRRDVRVWWPMRVNR